MRSIVDWILVFVVLASAALSARADEPSPLPLVVDRGAALETWPRVVPLADVGEVPPAAVGWCDAVEPPPCDPSAGCSAARDGTPRTCARQWYDDARSDYVCLVDATPLEIRKWRSARLRVLVDEICKPREGCNPNRLHAYLTTLARRESDMRPESVHRLPGDREANARAWRRLAHRYADSPAYGEPDRWGVGRGYYGQNAAVWLATWDATAVPEVLCGEVEATLVHLRAARRRWRRLAAGVACGGREHHGTASAGGASWYDISLVNSGSDACPGTEGYALRQRELFVRRSASRGLDAYGAVTLRSFGRVIPASEQDAFAQRMRERMDELHPQPQRTP